MRKHRPVPNFAAPTFAAHDAPMSELNTTPLIDVMLVLLIMFIVTVPIATHKVPLDLPQGEGVPRDPVVYRLELDAAGRISLDGRLIGDAKLPARLNAIAADPVAELHLRADGATPYDRFDRVLAAIRRSNVERLGMVGNERFVEALR
jgi:biopolymer transport protein ExbD